MNENTNIIIISLNPYCFKSVGATFPNYFVTLLSGMYEFSSTGQLLPILIGTQMDDPSGQMVLILGAERDPETDSLRPLGGTMEDPDGDGMLKRWIYAIVVSQKKKWIL